MSAVSQKAATGEAELAELVALRDFISDVVREAGGEATARDEVLHLALGAPDAPLPGKEEPAQEEPGKAEPAAVEPAQEAPSGEAEAPEAPEAGAEAEAPAGDPATGESSESQADKPAARKGPPPGSLDDLASRLQSRALDLVFQAPDVGPGRDLVARGSPLVRTLEAFLADQGGRCYVQAPSTARLSLKAIDEASANQDEIDTREQLGLASAKGTRVLLEERQDAPGYDLYVLYRVLYRARDREDRSVVVRVSLRPGVTPEGAWDIQAALAEPPAEVADWSARLRKRIPPALRNQGLDAADACLTQHAREAATKIQEVQRRSSEDDLSRLHAYYAGQIAEYMRRKHSDLNRIRIEELEAERELRIEELIRSAEVRVEGRALASLVVELPLQRARCVRRQDEEELASRWLLFDRSSGALEWESA